MNIERMSWRLRFRLKTLFAFVVIAAVLSWFLAAKIEQKRKERAAVAAIQKNGGIALYDWQVARREVPRGPAWARAVLGDDFLSDVVFVSACGADKATQVILGHLRFMPRVETLSFAFTKVSDSDLASVKELGTLRQLLLNNTRVGDAGLAHLEKLTCLEVLLITDSRATEAGSERLRRRLPKCSILVDLWSEGAVSNLNRNQ